MKVEGKARSYLDGWAAAHGIAPSVLVRLLEEVDKLRWGEHPGCSTCGCPPGILVEMDRLMSKSGVKIREDRLFNEYYFKVTTSIWRSSYPDGHRELYRGAEFVWFADTETVGYDGETFPLSALDLEQAIRAGLVHRVR